MLDRCERDHSGKHSREEANAGESAPEIMRNRNCGRDPERSPGFNLHGATPTQSNRVVNSPGSQIVPHGSTGVHKYLANGFATLPMWDFSHAHVASLVSMLRGFGGARELSTGCEPAPARRRNSRDVSWRLVAAADGGHAGDRRFLRDEKAEAPQMRGDQSRQRRAAAFAR